MTVLAVGGFGAGGDGVVGGRSGDIAALRGVGGDDQQGHAKAIDVLGADAVGVDVSHAGRADVIVQAAPVVPENEDDGVAPVNGSVEWIARAAGHALADGIDDVATHDGPRAGLVGSGLLLPGWSDQAPSGVTKLTCARLQDWMSCMICAALGGSSMPLS